MRTILLASIAAIGLAAAAPAFADEFGAYSSFQGDTMDRDGGHTGRLGAPRQDPMIYTGRSAAQDRTQLYVRPNDR